MIKTKTILFILQLIIWLPLLQKNIGFVEENPLNGEFIIYHKPTLDSFITKWKEGYYQNDYEKYFNENFGFRNYMVKLYNQTLFSLFDKSTMQLTEVGKNNQLFQSDYIDAYFGKDYIGQDSVDLAIDRIKFVKKEFEKMGTRFFLVIAPGKASFMPENLPSKYDNKPKDKSNYDAFIEKFKSEKIDYLDFREYFNTLKKNQKQPLFPKGGAHWSGYGVVLAMDSIIKNIQKQLNIKMVDLNYNNGVLTSNCRATDNDIVKGMNLLSYNNKEDLFYPELQFETKDKIIKPNALFIGDSFGESFYRFYPFFENCYGPNTSFWSYNIWEKWPRNYNKENKRVFYMDMKKELLNRDVVVLVITQINLRKLPTLFIERQYDFLKKLQTDKEYLNYIEIEQQNISNLQLNTNIYKYVNKKHYSKNIEEQKPEDKIKDLVNQIKNNPEWYNNVILQAKERGVSVDSMLVKSAKHWLKIH